MGERSGTRKKRINLITAKKGKQLIASMLVEGSVNSDVFNAWIENFLLDSLDQESFVIMDNASFHKTEKTKKLLTTRGHKLIYLPTYSPDLNPIEKDFAVLKKRRMFQQNISIDELIQTYGNLLK